MLDNDISPEQRKCLETAFEAADKNGDGILSADEYYEIFQTHGLSIGKKKTNTIMDKRLLNSFSCFIQERKSRKKCRKGCCCSVCRKGIVDINFTYPILSYLSYLLPVPTNITTDPQGPSNPPPHTHTHTETQNGPLPNNYSPMSMQCTPSTYRDCLANCNPQPLNKPPNIPLRNLTN